MHSGEIYPGLTDRKRQRHIIIAVFLVIVGVCLAIGLVISKKNESFAKVVGEYSDTNVIRYWEEKGEAYSIGVNIYGEPVFEDTEAAFKQAQIDFSRGFEYLQKYEKLPKLSAKKSVCKQYHQCSARANPPMTITDYKIVGEQCRQICAFFSIYMESFGMDYN